MITHTYYLNNPDDVIKLKRQYYQRFQQHLGFVGGEEIKATNHSTVRKQLNIWNEKCELYKDDSEIQLDLR